MILITLHLYFCFLWMMYRLWRRISVSIFNPVIASIAQTLQDPPILQPSVGAFAHVLARNRDACLTRTISQQMGVKSARDSLTRGVPVGKSTAPNSS